jgi:TRAP-type C4-dicarboxylate transport system substrate-binding protein
MGENLEMEKAWRDAGYNVVPVDVKDQKMALQSGMANAFFLSPLVATTAQYFTVAPNMCSLKVVPLIVGIVVTDRTWETIPDRHKEALLRSAREVVRGLCAEVKRKERETPQTIDLVLPPFIKPSKNTTPGQMENRGSHSLPH